MHSHRLMSYTLWGAIKAEKVHLIDQLFYLENARVDPRAK